MKKIVLLASGLLCFYGAQAQFGIKGGINQSVVSGKIGKDAEYKTSYHAGIVYQAKVLGPLSLQPELLYSLQGNENKSTFTKTKLHYVTLPVLAKVTLGPIFVEAGPQFGYLVSAQDGGVKVTSTNGSSQSPVVNNQTQNDEYKRGDFSLAAGAGVKLGKVISVGARFTSGITSVKDVQNVGGLNDEKLRNRVFQAYMSLQVPNFNR